MVENIHERQAKAKRPGKPRVSAEKAKKRNELFNRYIPKYYNLVYKLCIKYTWDSKYIEDNYTDALVNLYQGIETYRPEMSLINWIHVCTKRFINRINKRRLHSVGSCIRESANVEHCPKEDTCDILEPPDMDVDNWRDSVGDGLLEAIDGLKPIYRDAFLMQQAGYSLREIMQIEYAKGTMHTRSISTVKNRVFYARKYIMGKIDRYGEKKDN